MAPLALVPSALTMFTPAEDNVPLLAREKDEAHFSLAACESKTVSTCWRYHTTVLVTSLGLNIALLLALVYLAAKQSQSIEWKGARPIYSRSHSEKSDYPKLMQLFLAPAREAVVHELVLFERIRHVKSRFDGPPSDEVDKAWNELYQGNFMKCSLLHRMIIFDLDGISGVTKSAAALLPNGTEAFTGDEQHYIVELDVFHQLHCLV